MKLNILEISTKKEERKVLTTFDFIATFSNLFCSFHFEIERTTKFRSAEKSGLSREILGYWKVLGLINKRIKAR